VDVPGWLRQSNEDGYDVGPEKTGYAPTTGYS